MASDGYQVDHHADASKRLMSMPPGSQDEALPYLRHESQGEGVTVYIVDSGFDLSTEKNVCCTEYCNQAFCTIN